MSKRILGAFSLALLLPMCVLAQDGSSQQYPWNVLLIVPATGPAGGAKFGASKGSKLTLQDAQAIAAQCKPAVVSVAPLIRVRTQVIFGKKNWVPLDIYGTTPSFLEVRQWQDLDEGKPFTDADVAKGRHFCIVGQTIVRELFG